MSTVISIRVFTRENLLIDPVTNKRYEFGGYVDRSGCY